MDKNFHYRNSCKLLAYTELLSSHGDNGRLFRQPLSCVQQHHRIIHKYICNRIASGAFFSAKLMDEIGIRSLLLIDVGLSYGMASTSVSTLVTSQIPKERHGEGIGYFMLSTTLGAAIGPFFGVFLISHGGFPYIFMMCIFTAVLCFLGSLLCHVNRPWIVPPLVASTIQPLRNITVRGPMIPHMVNIQVHVVHPKIFQVPVYHPFNMLLTADFLLNLPRLSRRTACHLAVGLTRTAGRR